MRILSLLITMSITAGVGLSAEPADSGWPHVIEADGNRIVIYKPQVDSWEGGKLQARAAVSVTMTGAPRLIFGALWLSARTSVDQVTRTVNLYAIEATQGRFPAAGTSEPNLLATVRRQLPYWEPSIAVDRLMADLAITQAERKSEEVGLKTDRPRIIVSDSPAVLVIIDGDRVLRPVPGTESLMRIINTPATLALNESVGEYYLDSDRGWLVAPAIDGPWALARDLPMGLEKLSDSGKSTPHENGDIQAVDPSQPLPRVIICQEPAELIEISGQPSLARIPGTGLLYVTNTQDDVLVDAAQHLYYVLLAGRWYSSSSLADGGPWKYVPGSALPADFALIPPDHPKASVLASVPNTPQARDAVLASQVPQTAEVKRSEARLTVTYDGDPKFQPIESIGIAYAVNASDDVIRVKSKYYAVHDGVWFVASSPLGPWAVCDWAPPEIYSIPPSVPVYNARYVYVYDSTPDLVYVGYTPGYLGSYILDGCVVFGTGFYYPGWMGNVYFGRPWTWGLGFHYSYWDGGWIWRPQHQYWYSNWPRNYRVFYNHSDTATNLYDRWGHGAVISRRGFIESEWVRRAGVPSPRFGTPSPAERNRDVYAGCATQKGQKADFLFFGPES